MHNRWFIEVDNEDKWHKTWDSEMFFDFDEAVEHAKKLVADHDEVRVVDECYGRTWCILKKGEIK